MNVTEAREQVQQLKGQLRLFRTELSSVNDILSQYLSLSRRFGLPDNVMSAIVKLQQLRLTIMAAVRAFQLLQVAYLGSGPIGWALAAAGIVTTFVMTADLLELDRRERNW